MNTDIKNNRTSRTGSLHTRQTSVSIGVHQWLLVLLLPVTAVAHEITVINFSGGTVTAGPLNVPVGKWTFTWPYAQSNWIFNYRGVTHSFPVTQDFHLLIDRTQVYQTLVLSTTEWFFLGFGLATTMAGFFWIVRIVNQLMKANPEVQ